MVTAHSSIVVVVSVCVCVGGVEAFQVNTQKGKKAVQHEAGAMGRAAVAEMSTNILPVDVVVVMAAVVAAVLAAVVGASGAAAWQCEA